MLHLIVFFLGILHIFELIGSECFSVLLCGRSGVVMMLVSCQKNQPSSHFDILVCLWLGSLLQYAPVGVVHCFLVQQVKTMRLVTLSDKTRVVKTHGLRKIVHVCAMSQV